MQYDMQYDTPIPQRDPMLLTKQEQLSWLVYEGATIVEDLENENGPRVQVTYMGLTSIIKIDDK
jgi:hypothetical protein